MLERALAHSAQIICSKKVHVRDFHIRSDNGELFDSSGGFHVFLSTLTGILGTLRLGGRGSGP